MKGSWRWLGWVAFAILVVVLLASSLPDRGMRDGERGSYLGRTVADGQTGANRAQDLSQRVAAQRY